ncbi:HD-GYP domain-containing protein [Pseudoduganella namucuonensis]|uniref:HD domain-containing protein n=1 Tax=Pseudoduganella namucuonensis TaxID=1035707 RepID=A0A1I7L2M4_9BURK|nr:HD domain-containing phosphohydrolase [Pseudoduganella namucuonensis]SFV03868.1 HD domain-containing protein [Pseudoduganella namucuonensis]
MKIRKIGPGDLRVGQLLPWDVYGAGGGLLALKGQLIANSSQLDSLVERGVYDDAGERPEGAEPASVLRLLNGAALALQAVLEQIAGGMASDARGKLEEVAGMVARAVALNADIAVASILHNQRAMPYPVRHSVDTAVVTQIVAASLNKPDEDVRTATLAALTMNVGMLAGHARLHALTAPLSADDRRLIQAHPQAGVALLRQAGVDHPDWLSCVLHHHENEDGSGYPSGKGGAQVPESAKLVALADRYCARVSQRGYRQSLAPNAALRDILLEGKTTLGSLPAAVLIRELGIYPIGTRVRLRNGEIGVVSRKGLNSTSPWVTSLTGPRGAPLDPFPQRDTRSDQNGIREVLAPGEPAAEFRMSQVWGSAALP